MRPGHRDVTIPPAVSAPRASPGVGRGAAAAFAVRAGGAALALGSTVALTRMLGAAGYGAYAWATAWVLGLVVPAGLGADRLLVRELAAARATARAGTARGLVRQAGRAILGVSCALTLATGAAVLAFHLADRAFERALLAALPALPLLALGVVPLGVLQGLHRTGAALAPSMLVRQAALLLLVGGAWTAGGDDVSPTLAAALFALAAAVALAAGVVPAGRALRGLGGAGESTAEDLRGLRPLLPFAVISAALTLQAAVGVLVVGALDDAVATARYAIAAQLTLPFVLLLTAVSTSLSPSVAALHAEGRRDELQRELARASRFVAALSAAAALLLVAAAGPLLELFGEDFASGGAPVLRLMALAALANALTPFNGLVLTMTGHEAAAARVAVLGLALAAGLSVALVPPLGPEGAAIAFLVSIVVRNVGSSVAAWRALRLDTSFVGR